MGTWSLPQTTKQAKELKKLMKKPLLAENAEDKLYHLTGDDVLFDDIIEDRNEYGNDYDLRPLVKSFIEDTLKQYSQSPEDFKNPFENEALEILNSIISTTI